MTITYNIKTKSGSCKLSENLAITVIFRSPCTILWFFTIGCLLVAIVQGFKVQIPFKKLSYQWYYFNVSQDASLSLKANHNVG